MATGEGNYVVADMPQKLKKKIQRKVADSGLTQTEIARKAGVSQGTIYKLLHTNTKHDYDTIKKICKVIDMDPKEVFLSIHAPEILRYLKPDIAAKK